MKFLLDAQLAPTLRQLFIDKGYDCIHTFILVKLGNTSRKELIQFFHEKFEEIIEKLKKEDMLLLSKE